MFANLTLLSLTLSLTLSLGCSSKESECEDAFEHMTSVSQKEMQSLPAEQRKLAEEVAKMNEGKDKEKRRKFVAKCKEGGIDTACIMKASDTMEYIGCFSSAK